MGLTEDSGFIRDQFLCEFKLEYKIWASLCDV